MATCNNYAIVCSEYTIHKGYFEYQLSEMYEESIECDGIDVALYPINRVFLTENEAMMHMH